MLFLGGAVAELFGDGNTGANTGGGKATNGDVCFLGPHENTPLLNRDRRH